MTFRLAQSDPNESNPNRKTAPPPHHTKPHRTVPKPIFIGAGVGAYNRRAKLTYGTIGSVGAVPILRNRTRG